jgi:hypothetical protein
LEHRFITLSGAALKDQDVWAAFDAELQAALLANVAGVAVNLVPQMPADIKLLDWLESWQKEFAGVGKEFIIVAEDYRQLHCLEISHPDQNLRYVASLEELWHTFPAYHPAGPAAAEPELPPAPAPTPAVPPQLAPVPVAPPPVAVPVLPTPAPPPPKPAPAPLEPPSRPSMTPQSPQLQSEHTPPETTPPARVKAGVIIRASGEYACLGCGATRMYAKGDRAAACENAECQGPNLGWKLIFELF